MVQGVNRILIYPLLYHNYCNTCLFFYPDDIAQINSLLSNQQEVIKGLETFSKKIETVTGMELFTSANAQEIAKKNVKLLSLHF
jgi:hypothetical protein